jgi:hypothetical protein
VGADQHLAQLDKVAVLLIVDFDDTPGVATATDAATISSSYLRVGTDNGEGNLGHDLLVLGNGLLIVELVAGTLENLDRVLFDIGKDLEELASTISIGLVSTTYTLLESGNLLVGQGISLGNDGNEVNLGVETAHNLNVQGLQGVARRLNEVDTGVDAVVDNVAAVDLVLSLEIGIVALLDVLDNWAPRVIVVDKVTESGGIDHAQAEADTVLLNVGAGRLDRHGLGDDIGVGASALLRGVE